MGNSKTGHFRTNTVFLFREAPGSYPNVMLDVDIGICKENQISRKPQDKCDFIFIYQNSLLRGK